MHWTQEEKKEQEGRRFWMKIFTVLGGGAFAFWQQNLFAGLAFAAFLDALYNIARRG